MTASGKITEMPMKCEDCGFRAPLDLFLFPIFEGQTKCPRCNGLARVAKKYCITELDGRFKYFERNRKD